MTPQRAYELLKELFPWLTKIRPSQRNQLECWGGDYCHITFSDAPPKWRPITVADIARYVGGEKFRFRVEGWFDSPDELVPVDLVGIHGTRVWLMFGNMQPNTCEISRIEVLE